MPQKSTSNKSNWQKNKPWILPILIIILFGGAIVGIVYLILYFVNKSKSKSENENLCDPPELDPTNALVFVDDPRKYFSITSTEGINGRYLDGSTEYNGKITPGLVTREDMLKYPLTYAFGHPWHERNSSWGVLRDGSWNAAVDCVALNLKKTINLKDITPNVVLVIEPKDINNQTPVYLDQSIHVKGIVVQHGGILLIKGSDIPIVITTEFILIESGGLFQAGSEFGDGNYRFPALDGGQRAFEIRLRSSDLGYGKMGVPASEYTYQVYAPGVVISESHDEADIKFAGYTGMQTTWNNGFGPKCVCVGFNGAIHLAGAVSSSVKYKGTWSAGTEWGKRDFLNENNLLTYEGENSDIQESYANVWTNLNETANVDDRKIKLDISVLDHLEEWRPGYQILITCQTKNYSTDDNLRATVPVWLDQENVSNNDANYVANQSERMIFKEDGVEIATIESIEGTTITLVNPLKFRHMSFWHHMHREGTDMDVEDIYIDTRVHVALLSRNIRITSEYNANNESPTGSGGNIWYWTATAAEQMLSGRAGAFRSQLLEKNPPHRLQKTVQNRKNKVNVQTTDFSGFQGSGGAVLCNFEALQTNDTRVTQVCYDKMFENESQANAEYCQTERPIPNDKMIGHWIFGSEGLKGSNALLGGHCMFRYGSSVHIDAVELPRMGVSGNFGTIGQYPLHFHLMGHPQHFREYLRENSILTDRRAAKVINSSIYQSFNRWVTVHGTLGVDVVNNVGFISYGSGYFTEDGNERNNKFEHNVGCMTLPTRVNEYYNPLQLALIGSVGSDLCFPSTMWFKNNQNRCIRNVLCNSPTPVIGIWGGVPLIQSKLRGFSMVCIGDEERKLPSLASFGNAMGRPNNASLSQNGNNVKDKNPPCWAPEDFWKKYAVTGKDNCINMAVDNESIPYQLCAENVVYQIAGFWSEFNDTHFSPYNTGQCSKGQYGALGKPGGIMPEGPLFLPRNAQTSCVDEGNISRSTYFKTVWGAGNIWKKPENENLSNYPYQPINQTELEILDTESNVEIMNNIKSTTFPKFLVSNLAWNMSRMYGALFLGASWSKLSPTFLINNAFLALGGGFFAGIHGTQGTENNRLTSSAAFSLCGDAHNVYPNVYIFCHNHITDGGFSFAPNPMLLTGDKTFFSDSAAVFIPEYTDKGGAFQQIECKTEKCSNNNACCSGEFYNMKGCEALGCGIYYNEVAVNNYYFGDGITHSIFPKNFWEKGSCNKTSEPVMYLYDINNQKKYKVQVNQSGPQFHGEFELSDTRKYAYLCGADNQLFKDTDSEYMKSNPSWNGIVSNAMCTLFQNNYGKDLGNRMCEFLSYIEPCNATYDEHDSRQKMVGCEV